MHRILIKITVSASLLLSSWLVQAGESEEAILDVLTCSGTNDRSSFSAAWDELEARGRPAGDGAFKLQGRIQNGPVCVEDATVLVAFGALGVVAGVCDGNVRPLVERVQKMRPELLPVAVASQPGVLSKFEDPTYTITLFKGPPTVNGQPDRNSKQVSYMCSLQVSGPQ